ncbi:MAG: peptide-methionine (S)-S-oxide reductase MsrA [Acidobacteria bacterium]|nr:peptide-methionine (S)-S-oxide reductase MsrA [Acidobacteriota bacterium]
MQPGRGSAGKHRIRILAAACVSLALTGCTRRAVPVPPPVLDAAPGTSAPTAIAVLAGGCFWGVQAVFENVRGVIGVTSGYAGGSREDARYDLVATGRTGHAESVRIAFDPAKISYGRLLQVFFSVVHDPTELNRQGPDWGTQYRSAVFYANQDQKRIAEAYIRQLNTANVFGKPLVTRLTPLEAFYPAEPYHQDYVRRHPDSTYVILNDLPKLERLREAFPALAVEH